MEKIRIVVPAVKPRNLVAVAAMTRKGAGAHQPSRKRARHQAALALKRGDW